MKAGLEDVFAERLDKMEETESELEHQEVLRKRPLWKLSEN
jgi:hypothetical protein